MKKRHSSIEDDFFSLAKPFSNRKLKRKRSLAGVLPETIPGSISGLLSPVPLHSGQLQTSHISSDSSFSSTRLPSTDQDNIPSRCSSITPPPVVDRDALRSQIEQRLRNTTGDPCPITDDEDEDFNADSLLSSKPITEASEITTERTESNDKSKYCFNEDNESKRIYSLVLYSKLSVPVNVDGATPTIFRLKGTKLFLRVLEQSIKYFRAQYAQTLSPPQLAEYDPDHTILIWVEGKMALKLFYRPLTLRIPPPDEFDMTTCSVGDMAPTELTCILIPQAHAQTFTSIYPEFVKKSSTPVPDFTLLNTGLKDFPTAQVDPVISDPPPRSQTDFFVIGLKGRDNKRVDIEVNGSTSLAGILLHYAKVKSIEPHLLEKAKLLFDDEPLDLSLHVADTELEEDFEIQVVF